MEAKIRILFLHSGAEMYGADQILMTIVSGLDKKKYEPIVVLPNGGPLLNELKKKDIKVSIIPYPIIRRKYFNPSGIIKLIKEYFSSCNNLKNYVEEEKIDIIHNNTIAVLEGIYLKRKTSVTLITHVHEMIDKPKIVAKFLYKIHLKYCDKMIVVSNSVKNHISKLLRKNINKIEVIHNGIEPINTLVDRNKYYSEFNIPKEAKIVAVIGRINAIKGQDHFIKAMKNVVEKNDNVYGLIIGDAFPGQEWRVDDLRKTIKNNFLEKKIIYCGYRSDVMNLYKFIDLLVLPSIQNDSFPTVVLEAMSCGVPTIAYKCGGVEEMIQNSTNGFLIEQGNIKELSEYIEKVINDENLLEFLSKNAKENFKSNFTIERFLKNMEKAYKTNGGLDE